MFYWHSVCCVKNTGDKLLYKRINIIFLVQLQKNITGIYRMLQEDYEEGTQVLMCYAVSRHKGRCYM